MKLPNPGAGARVQIPPHDGRSTALNATMGVSLRMTPLTSLRAMLAAELPGTARMMEVARLKGRAQIALGYCFPLATAAASGAVLLTGDPEILDLHYDGNHDD